MKKRVTCILAAVALLSVLTAGLGTAGAYFTDRDDGSQSHEIQLGDSTTVTETTVDWTKQVTITNNADSSEAVWVRARAYAGEDIQDLLVIGGENWSGTKNDWYYYSAPVQPGEPAKQLLVQVPEQKVNPKEAAENMSFNVVVVYETTPVADESMTCQAAFANADSVQSSQTGGES